MDKEVRVAKQYGVTCDRCRGRVYTPSQHYKLVMACSLNSLDEIKADLCPNCYEAVRNFLSIYESVKENNERG